MSEGNIKFHIVGAGRGGTSLLAGLLDNHPGLEVGFEQYSIEYLMGASLPYRGPELFHKRVTAYVSACEQLAKRHPDVFWGNKITTEQIFGLEEHNLDNPESEMDILDVFFNDYLNDTAIIFILRDGRTCINSKVERTGQSKEKACERWQYSVLCYKFFKNCHVNNICVRFEDLLLHPQAVLTRICNFLRIPYQQEMLAGTNSGKMLPEYRRNGFDLTKTKVTDSPDDYMIKIKDDLKYCEYL